MRKLGGYGVPNVPSPEVFSILQLCAITEHLFPNIKTLDLSLTGRPGSIPFIPLFLSPRTTAISIQFPSHNFPKVMVPSMITALPTLCPNLQEITLQTLPRDFMTIAAVSAMLLASNRNTLRCFSVESSLTAEAREVVYTLPVLRTLWSVIERDALLPAVVLPNLTDLTIAYDYDSDWSRVFRGATLGPLETVTFYSEPEQLEDFLEEFERVALATSIQNTLSTFQLYTSHSWSPYYYSLQPFTQMTCLVIYFSCRDGCSSTVDDDVVTTLAPKAGNP